MGNSVSQGDLKKYALKTDVISVDESDEFIKTEDLKKLNLVYQTKGNYVLSEGLELMYQTKGNYALTSDLASYQTKGNYALTSDLASYQTKGNYALTSDLASYQTKGNYALTSDLASYALTSDLASYQTKGNYALISDIPTTTNFVSKKELNSYQLKSTLDNDLKKYALDSDLNKYVLTSALTAANYATKGDLNLYQLKSNLDNDLKKYALDSDLKKYQLKGDNKLELNDSKANSYAPFIILNNSGGGAGNQVGIKLNPWSGRPGGDSSLILAEDDGNASSNLQFYTAKGPEGKPTERMRITSDGQVSVKGKLDTDSLTIGGIDLKPANFATKGDLASYAKTKDLTDYAKIDPTNPYVTTSSLNAANYAKKTDIPSLTDYAKKTDIPSLTGYAKETEFNGYTFSPYKTFDTTVSATPNQSFNQCKTLCTNDNNCVAFKFPVTNYKNKTNSNCFIYKEAKPEKSESTSHLFYKN